MASSEGGRMGVVETIIARRSVRDFTPAAVAPELVHEILEAGRWAPSGLNNQPWRFVTIGNPEVKGRVAACTKYRRIVEACSVAIAVFIDREAMYNPMKDYQGIGACLQNMLLAAHSLGLGAVWLGEILNRKDEVREILELPERYELMAVLAVGVPAHQRQRSERKPLEELILKEV